MQQMRNKYGTEAEQTGNKMLLMQSVTTLRRSLRDGVFLIRIGIGQMKFIFNGLLMPNPARFSQRRFHI